MGRIADIFLGVVISFVVIIGYGVALKFGYIDSDITERPEFAECIKQAKLGNGSRFDCVKKDFENFDDLENK